MLKRHNAYVLFACLLLSSFLLSACGRIQSDTTTAGTSDISTTVKNTTSLDLENVTVVYNGQYKQEFGSLSRNASAVKAISSEELSHQVTSIQINCTMKNGQFFSSTLQGIVPPNISLSIFQDDYGKLDFSGNIQE